MVPFFFSPGCGSNRVGGMVEPNSPGDRFLESSDGEEEFRSCCGEDEEWKEVEESEPEESKDALDEFSLRLFFKGISVCQVEGSSSGLSGIGVVMERLPGVPVIQVQKKLDFNVEEYVAEHLALMDGLLEALRSGIRRILAFTDSQVVYDQIAKGDAPENQLLIALGQRILEHANKLQSFVLKLVPSSELARSLHLAKEAIGLVENCPMCCEEKQPSQMVMMTCSHKFCSRCMITYVEGKLQASHVPIGCPQLGCKYYISPSECKAFLPDKCFESFERALLKVDVLNLERVYCPFPNCSVLLRPSQLSAQSSSSQSETNCVECSECHRLICINCGVPWHLSLSCGEYQDLHIEEREAGDITLHRLVESNNWRRCQQCRRMIERTQGCYHMTCWCGHEFCFSCGSEFRDGEQTCHCVYWDEENHEPSIALSNQDSGLWRWESFQLPPATLSMYSEQERSQLALMQRFLSGGFGMGDQNPHQSPPRCSDSYVDTIKDLHQLPWLERFVSVISDNYQEGYIQ